MAGRRTYEKFQWSASSDALLQRWLAAGMTLATIARRLGTTPGIVSERAKHLLDALAEAQ